LLDADVGDGLAGPDAQRVRELEAENKEMTQELRELRRANDIVRKAPAFSRRSSTAHTSDRRFHR
jgi:transposase-like protein